MEKLYSINDLSKLSGLSKRTLHYYDEIGLLKPDHILDNGYRKYETSSLRRLQEICFYKELDFPLKEILRLLNHPHYDAQAALINQRDLLQLKKKRLQALIDLLEDNIKGEHKMDFNAFSAKEIRAHQDKYSQATKDKYGHSPAYKMASKKYETYSDQALVMIQTHYDEIFKALAQSVGQDPQSPGVQELVKQWQDHISNFYYTCTDQILAGLADMYRDDETFRASMDKYGPGTTDLLIEAIKHYCKK